MMFIFKQKPLKLCTSLAVMTSSKHLIHTSRTLMKFPISFRARDNRGSGAGFDFGKWFLFLVPCAGVGLGTWQWRRKNWKRGIVHDLQTKTTCEPIPFPETFSQLKELEYRPLMVRGTYDHSREIHVGPRSLNEERNVVVTNTKLPETNSGLLSQKNHNIGFHVITPFKLENGQGEILINRGYVSRAAQHPGSRPEGQVEGIVDQVGILRTTEKQPTFGLSNNPEKNYWFFKDVDVMAAHVGADPVLLDATPEATLPGGPIGGQTRVDLRDEHVSYMITWYGLAICTFLTWFKHYYK